MFDARHPDFQANAAALPLAGLAPIKVSSEVFGKVGESFAVALSALQRSLAALDAGAPDWQLRRDAACAEVARLEQFAVQIQQLARMLGGKAPLLPERLDLAESAHAALAQWSRLAEAGRAIAPGTPPLPGLDVNAAALAQLLDFGIEYALQGGSPVEVEATLQGQPPRPTLTIRSGRAKAGPAIVEEPDEVHWLLFVQLAGAIGLSPERRATGETTTLTLRFPAVDELRPGDVAPHPALPHTASASGRRVLLIEPHDFTRVQAYRLLHDIGVAVDASGSVEQAREGLRGDPPDAVVTGIPVDDEHCAALLDALRAEQPRLRVIELVDDDDAFSFSVPGSAKPARVGRHDLARTLTSALAQELDAA